MTREERIMNGVKDHWADAQKSGQKPQFTLGIFLQGSQNYCLDYEDSDIDTKLIVLPTFKNIIHNDSPISTTFVRENDEHTDYKDVRLYVKNFMKQNINFLEILFTNFCIVNKRFEEDWLGLRLNREKIAHYNRFRALKAMKGMTLEKYAALEHPYPSKKEVLERYGYDCYHPDTLFLTKRGWLKYDEIFDSDELGTMNPNTFEIEWQHYTDRISKAPSGDMYEGETYNTHFCITDTHNVFTHIIKNRNKCGLIYNPNLDNEWKLEPLNQALSHNTDRHVISFPINKQPDNPNFSDDMLKLFGAFISEGSINFRDKEQLVPRAVRICQTNHGKKEFFDMMNSITTVPMNKYDFTRKDATHNNIETVWTLGTKYAKLFLEWGKHGSKNKRLPNWIYDLSERQAKILLKAMWLGDGTEHQSRYIYYTSSKELAKDTCALANLAGYTSNVLGGEEGYHFQGKLGYSIMWQVQITKRIENHIPSSMKFVVKQGNKRNANFKKLPILPNKVVCFTVPNGLLITMYKGKTAVQGNCKQLHHILRINDFISRYTQEESFADCLIPTNPEFLIEVKKGNVYDLDRAREVAKEVVADTVEIADKFCELLPDRGNPEVDELFDEFLCNVMKESLSLEFNNFTVQKYIDQGTIYDF